MLGYRCKDCHVLLAEMHSAAMEAKAIAHDARALSRARNLPEPHPANFGQIRDHWQNARRKWVQASMDFKNHFATHRSAPT
jgi:hypothetical protein